MDNDTIEGVVQTQIESPRYIEEGAANYDQVYMPAELVTGQDAEDVATYVASVAGVRARSRRSSRRPQLFAEKCGICHALEAAGHDVRHGPGPRPGARRQGRGVHRGVDRRPDTEIAQGYSAGIMPRTSRPR